MFKSVILALAFVGAATAAPESSKFVLNKLPAKNVTLKADVQKGWLKPAWNKTDSGKMVADLLPNVTALKGAPDELMAKKMEALSKDIDLMERVSKADVLDMLPNKTAIRSKLDAFKDGVAGRINATLHMKD